ncbi:MAG: YjdF family protein [Cellulosilyticaceae bacterium]
MFSSKSKLTILFEEPFWIGIYECESNNSYEMCKITFGTEPKDYEIYEMILQQWNTLKLNPPTEMKPSDARHINPKRMQRAIKKQVLDNGIGTKAQQALKLQQEQGKIERKIRSREQREAEKELKFELKQQKRKQKHKGH